MLANIAKWYLTLEIVIIISILIRYYISIRKENEDDKDN